MSRSHFETTATKSPGASQNADEVLRDCVSTTLKGVLGEKPADALIFHLGGPGSIDDPASFSQRLELVIGGAADTIRRLILKAMYLRVGISISENESSDFEGSVRRARELLFEKGSKS